MKTVLITGASSGIGKASALEFYRHGYAVSLLARRKDKLESLARELGGTSTNVLVLPCDVTQRAEIDHAVRETIRQFGRIDILINNAGAGLNSMFESTDPEAIRKVFEVNFMGVVHATQAVIPEMKARRRGQIINISSIAGRRAFPSRSIYGATKFALEGLSESLRVELAPFGIEVIVIRPTVTDTEFFDSEPQGKESVLSLGHKRMSPEKVARIIYRASETHKRSVNLSFPGKLVLTLNTLAPSFVDWVVGKVFTRLRNI